MNTLTWTVINARDGHVRSACGRFDLWRTALGYWIVTDAEGGICRGDEEKCRRWCGMRRTGRASA